MARTLAIVLLLLALMAPAAAHAQTNPFGPLPQAAEPTPAPTDAPGSTADQADVSRGLLLGIAGVVLLAFVGIGMYIARDARRSLTDHDRRQIDHVRTEQEKRRGEVVKRQARSKGKAQRQARKAQRRR